MRGPLVFTHAFYGKIVIKRFVVVVWMVFFLRKKLPAHE